MCNLVAPGAENTQGAVQAEGREGTDGAGNGTVGDYLLQTVPEPEIPVIERAIETAAQMLGSDRSRGYCLEMTCAEFMAGAKLDNGDPAMLLFSMTRSFKFCPKSNGSHFWRRRLRRCHESDSTQSSHACGWILNRMSSFVKQCCKGMAGDARHAAQRRALRFIVNNIAASPEMTQNGT